MERHATDPVCWGQFLKTGVRPERGRFEVALEHWDEVFYRRAGVGGQGRCLVSELKTKGRLLNAGIASPCCILILTCEGSGLRMCP